MQKITLHSHNNISHIYIMENITLCKALQHILCDFSRKNTVQSGLNKNIVWRDSNEDGKIIQRLAKKFIILEFDDSDIESIINPYHDYVQKMNTQI